MVTLTSCARGKLMGIKATVLVPTSIDRGPLLPLSIGSIQRQTLREIEIFIIGDGVEEITRQQISDLIAQDPRIRFFDHPKHRRRGEPYRHAALQEARGEIVCYMCDRDLMLPDHVETMHRLLQGADFATTLLYHVHPDVMEGRIKGCLDAADPADRARLATGPSADTRCPHSDTEWTITTAFRMAGARLHVTGIPINTCASSSWLNLRVAPSAASGSPSCISTAARSQGGRSPGACRNCKPGPNCSRSTLDRSVPAQSFLGSDASRVPALSQP